METVFDTPVKFTDAAKNEVGRLVKDGALAGEKYLRVGVKGGGCSGMTYILEFDELKPNDEQFNAGGLTFIIDKSHSIYLMGMEVDWEGGLNSRGFVFKNPNASSTCGCGTSFAV